MRLPPEAAESRLRALPSAEFHPRHAERPARRSPRTPIRGPRSGKSFPGPGPASLRLSIPLSLSFPVLPPDSPAPLDAETKKAARLVPGRLLVVRISGQLLIVAPLPRLHPRAIRLPDATQPLAHKTRRRGSPPDRCRGMRAAILILGFFAHRIWASCPIWKIP